MKRSARSAAAEREPRERVKAGVGVEADVAELRVEIGVGRVGMAGGGLDALLRARVTDRRARSSRARAPASGREPCPRSRAEPARADGVLVDVEIEQVAALAVRALQRLLHVEQEAGEVLAQAHVRG